MDNIDNMKSALRTKLGTQRNLLSSNDILEKSMTIKNHFLSLALVNPLKKFMSYVSVGNEVRTIEIINELLIDNKEVSVPLCVPETTQLIASQIFDLNELSPTHFGLLEPRNAFIRAVDPLELDLVLIPGLGFDRGFNRLGHGKGYYDRFLSKLSKDTLKIGLAFSIQIVEEVPIGSHDIPLDIIITEEGIIQR
ncbi:MAG: 5-formyltetrahydrofolate cyclo-ligase [Clostridiales bacterium]|nr:5-formyltetrahydrofolate cyclo-ligase [Clostridiales bacterium]